MKTERLLCKNVDSGKRIDVFLYENECAASRSAAALLISDGNVLLNGASCKKSDLLTQGDEITVTLPDMKDPAAKPEDIKIDIVYEDAHLLVVNKPKGMVVHPAPGNESGTLVNALLYKCAGSLSGINGVARPGIVHRIDKDTSGLLIVAKTDAAHIGLAGQISKHTFKRVYEGVCFGRFENGGGVIERPVGRSERDRKKMAIIAGGKAAVTYYNSLAVYNGAGVTYSHMGFTLKTGRTHQIRVHCASLGHHVAGDAVYGNPERDRKYFPELEGQCLHAACIGFTHPVTGSYLEFYAPPPEYFKKVLTKLLSWDKIM